MLHGIGDTYRSMVNGHVQQKSVAVASARMMPEVGLSQMQLGWIETAFLLMPFAKFPEERLDNDSARAGSWPRSGS